MSLFSSVTRGVAGDGRGKRLTAHSVLFCDFDGPIVDVSERYYQTYQLGLRALGASPAGAALTPLSKAQFWALKRDRVSDRDIAERSGVPAQLTDPFLEQVCRIVNHPQLLQWDRLQPGAVAALAQLKQAGFRLVLVTLRHPRQVQAFLQAHSLSQQIDQVFGAADLRAAHANRVEQKTDLLQRAILEQQRRGICVRHAYMIGDTEADLLAGQTAALRTIALTCGIRSESYLRQFGPTVTCASLLEAVRGLRPVQAA